MEARHMRQQTVRSIAIVQIDRYGQDRGLFVDGQCILTADPLQGDDVDAVDTAADGLAGRFGIEVVRVSASPDPEWQWDDVIGSLVEKEKLPSAAADERSRGDERSSDSLGEVHIETAAGAIIAAPAYPQECSYVRLIDENHRELAYWDHQEWREQPEEVMGALIGAIASGSDWLKARISGGAEGAST